MLTELHFPMMPHALRVPVFFRQSTIKKGERVKTIKHACQIANLVKSSFSLIEAIHWIYLQGAYRTHLNLRGK